MRSWNRLGWALALLCTASCGSSPPPAARVRHRRAGRRPAAVVDRTDVVATGEFRPIREEPDGSWDVVVGGLRANVRDADVKLARDAFATPIAAAVPVASGWVFVAHDGTAARSETFLGPLERVGSFPGVTEPAGEPVGPALRGSGRAALVDRHGVVWTSDGSRPFERLAADPPGPATQCLFASETVGAAVLVGGDAYVTRDAGRTWARATGWPSTVNLAVRDGRLTSDRLIDAVVDDGAARFVGVPNGASREREPDPEALDLGAIDALRRARNPLLAPAQELPDGSLLSGQAALDPENATVRHLYAGLNEGGVTGWTHSFSYSMGRHGSRSVSVDLRRYVGSLDDAGAALLDWDIYAPDGVVGASLVAPSTGDRTAPPSLHWGAASVQGEVALAEPLARLLATDGRTVVATTRGPDFGDGRVVRVDLASGAVTPLDFDERALAGRADVLRDGTVLAFDGANSLRVSHPDGARASRPLPAGTVGFDFADHRRGMAWSEDHRALWRTTDGGDTWRPLALPLDPPGAFPTRLFSERPWTSSAEQTPLPGTRCLSWGCVVSGLVAVRGWAELPPDQAPIFWTPQEPVAPSTWPAAGALPSFRCTATGRAMALPPWRSSQRGAVREFVGRSPAGEALFRTWADSERGLRAQVRWRSVRDGVTTTGATGELQPVGEPQALDPGSTFVTPLSLHPDLVSIVEAGDYWSLALSVARGETRLSAEVTPWRGALAVSPGSGASALVAPGYLGAVDVASRLGSRGLVIREDRDPRYRFAPAEYDGREGAALFDPLEPGRVGYVAGAPDAPMVWLPLPPADRVPVCTGPASDRALRVAVPFEPTSPVAPVTPTLRAERTLVELGPSGPCVRGLQRTEADAALNVVARDGALVGVRYGPDGIVPTRCTPVAP
ncbi:MAG: hypothetical protein Q8S73_28975 [Deltaproteobacteria bacterium]|nr:hypothetical protein [Myxococcales bacterium]MDP3218174.1 hypothetical protein [Deltaproteobacteria bacterium]